MQGAPVREYATAAEMRQHAKDVKARLMGGAPPPVRLPAPAAAPILPELTATDEPQPKRWVLVSEQEAQRLADQDAEREALRPEVPEPERFVPRHKQILRAVALHYGISIEAIRGERRTADIVRARQIAMVAIFIECPNLSLPSIGRVLGGKDHTTVLHAVRKFKAWPDRTWPQRLAHVRAVIPGTPQPATAQVMEWNGEGCA